MGKRESPIKVCLTNLGKDTETPWAEDLGDAPAPPYPDGSRLVRLVNVPFLHAKPTWGDTIVVTASTNDGHPTWDRNSVPFSDVDALIFDDGGRWAMIVDYVPHPDSPDADRTYATLSRACAEHDVVCEAAWGPRDGEPGRVYMAVRNELSDAALMKRLRNAGLPCELIQIHPTPTTKPAKKAAAKPAARPAAKFAAKTAAKSAAKPVKAATTPVTKHAAAPKSAAKHGAAKPPAKKPTAKAVAKPAARKATARPPAKKAAAKSTPKSGAKKAASPTAKKAASARKKR